MTEADREKVGWIRNGLVYACAEDLCRIIRELEAERDAARDALAEARAECVEDWPLSAVEIIDRHAMTYPRKEAAR